jgi:adenine-specific DNA-methyltransferase
MSAKSLGQFFTTAPELQEWIAAHIVNRGQRLLEPAVGSGHLLIPVLRDAPTYPITAYEIDPSLPLTVSFSPPHQTVRYRNFLTQVDPADEPVYGTCICNPPYVTQRGAPNLFIQFLDKCHGMVDPSGGELLFIVPSEFFRLTSAAPLLNRMTATGAFTDIWYPQDESLFADAAVDVVLFRYERGSSQGPVMVNGEPHTLANRNGILTFTPISSQGVTQATVRLGDHFDVFVSSVSGRDRIFAQSFGNMEMLTDKGQTRQFIVLSEFPSDSAQINAHMNANRAELLSRKGRPMTDSNWWRWATPRNMTAIAERTGQRCIYVRTITRKREIAWIDTVRPFVGALLCCVPKTPQGAMMLETVLRVLETVRESYTYAGRFKIGQKQMCELPLPNA